MTLTQLIKEEFGTLKRFCKIAGISADSLSVIMVSDAKSQPCIDALIKYGFIESAEYFPQYRTNKVDTTA